MSKWLSCAHHEEDDVGMVAVQRLLQGCVSWSVFEHFTIRCRLDWDVAKVSFAVSAFGREFRDDVCCFSDRGHVVRCCSPLATFDGDLC